MRIAYKAILIVVITILICTTQYYGQTADLQFVVTQNDQTINGTYSVKIQVKLDTEADMGTSTLQFTYNENGLSFPAFPDSTAGDYSYHNFQGFIPGGIPFTNYSSNVSRPILGTVSINIVLSIGADGQTISTNWMDVASISFTILDVNESSNLQWIGETTTIFDDQNNPFTNGALNNLDSPLPVELTSFTSKYLDDKVQLNWKTKTEVNNYGFNIERRINDGEWNTIGFVEGHGNSNSPKEYNYADRDLFAGSSNFQYRLKQIDTDGQFEYSDVVEVEVVPTQFELSQNYPNPFNPGTVINYQLPVSSNVILKVYDILGNEVATLVDEYKSAGKYKVTFSVGTSRDLSLTSGVYIYQLRIIDPEINSPNGQAGEEMIQTKKMMLLK